jgi:hypothetical protein
MFCSRAEARLDILLRARMRASNFSSHTDARFRFSARARMRASDFQLVRGCALQIFSSRADARFDGQR